MKLPRLSRIAQRIAAGVATAILAAPLSCVASDDYRRATDLFREGRLGEAYQGFSALANRGDPDAAHAALFMNKYGPLLFGSYWSADPAELAMWARRVGESTGRPHPAFVPQYPHPVAAKPGRSKPGMVAPRSAAPKRHGP